MFKPIRYQNRMIQLQRFKAYIYIFIYLKPYLFDKSTQSQLTTIKPMKSSKKNPSFASITSTSHPAMGTPWEFPRCFPVVSPWFPRGNHDDGALGEVHRSEAVQIEGLVPGLVDAAEPRSWGVLPGFSQLFGWLTCQNSKK